MMWWKRLNSRNRTTGIFLLSAKILTKKMNFSNYLLFATVGFVLMGCQKSTNKFSDDVIAKIADFQDRRQADSLVRYLLDRNPVYRIEAAKALASVQDSVASLQLGTMLLEDPLVEARVAAAFALGQTKGTASSNALIPALEDKESRVLREVLEGLGKTLYAYDLQNLKNFKAKDSISQEGFAWALYQIGLRGLADESIVSKQIEFLKPSYSLQTRIGAAHFFSRVAKLQVPHGDELMAAAASDKSAYVRMAATSGLRKLDSTKSIPVLLSIAKSDPDYRVRISAVRALAAWPSNRAMAGIIQSLTEANPHVGVAASEVIKPTLFFKDQINMVAQSTKNTRIQSNLFKASLLISDDQTLIDQIKAIYTSSNEYQKAALLVSLSATTREYEFIANELLHAISFVIKSTAAQALVAVGEHPTADAALKAKLATIYKEAILQGDPGVIGILAEALVNPEAGYKKILVDFNFLKEAKKKLAMPKDIEALQPLDEAIAFFEGKEKPASLKNQFNHPINWKQVKAIKKDQKVKIETTQGTIVLTLLVEDAPGSVANFVELVNKKYFDGKYFHRVVSNFVIQTGCNRGDGFGSEDYSIRSEFTTTRYKEGSVGMASAGKDTEGTQWFITHSPTPHLNGRYTIFAEVVEGMSVVHAIQVGDKINSISLL